MIKEEDHVKSMRASRRARGQAKEAFPLATPIGIQSEAKNTLIQYIQLYIKLCQKKKIFYIYNNIFIYNFFLKKCFRTGNRGTLKQLFFSPYDKSHIFQPHLN